MSQNEQEKNELSVQVPPIKVPPVLIQLDTPSVVESERPSQVKLSYGDGDIGTVASITISAPEEDEKKKEAPVQAKSFLGADLAQTSASLTMPPPTLTKVKKARNLVSPGMSMVKWMKLQENRIRPPTRRKIPLSEIAKHNSESDCWMVIRNCVYDVTEYIPYHPGGVPELMKGAGKDATALFNEIHKWVNYDSILKSCMKGYLLVDIGESFDETEEAGNDILAKSLVPSLQRPRTTFSQNDSSITFQVDTLYNDDLSEDNWCISVLNREFFLLKVILKPPDLWMSHVRLVQSLEDDSLRVNFQNSFRRAVITLNKPTLGQWKSLGSPLEDNNRIVDSRLIQMDDFVSGTIVSKENLTQDVVLIGVQVVSSSIVGVPVGFHLKLRLKEKRGRVRRYTPVSRSLLESSNEDNTNNDAEDRRVIYFIIKFYQDGKFTQELAQLPLNASLELGSVEGSYDPSFFSDCQTLALFAGGSGITPFVRVADFLRKRQMTYPVSRILLLFFNHTERDIIWKDQWEQLASQWNEFHFFPVISNKQSENSGWNGLKGRVDSVSLFKSILLEVQSKESQTQQENPGNIQFGKFKVMLCGSCGFNEACRTMLKTQDILPIGNIDKDIFEF